MLPCELRKPYSLVKGILLEDINDIDILKDVVLCKKKERKLILFSCVCFLDCSNAQWQLWTAEGESAVETPSWRGYG